MGQVGVGEAGSKHWASGKQLWKLKGEFLLVDLANDFYIARFTWKEDGYWALEGGPKITQGQCLNVTEWFPNYLG